MRRAILHFIAVLILCITVPIHLPVEPQSDGHVSTWNETLCQMSRTLSEAVVISHGIANETFSNSNSWRAPSLSPCAQRVHQNPNGCTGALPWFSSTYTI
ncbi:hypothetical protein GGR54DRAFT_604231 [Hypoxylon sp. NC1633]|nr:hypothetical protein GGR54DRAFT_604231 [Hypoxylon sp. NC1633]